MDLDAELTVVPASVAVRAMEARSDLEHTAGGLDQVQETAHLRVLGSQMHLGGSRSLVGQSLEEPPLQIAVVHWENESPSRLAVERFCLILLHDPCLAAEVAENSAATLG